MAIWEFWVQTDASERFGLFTVQRAPGPSFFAWTQPMAEPAWFGMSGTRVDI